MASTAFDVLIIGAGQAGEPLALALAKAGQRVGLIEAEHLGGSCVNYGCTPTKAVLASAQVAHLARRGQEFGIRIGEVQPDFHAVLERARGIVGRSKAFLEDRLANADNPRLLRGWARLAGRDGQRFRVEVDGQVLSAERVVLDTGTRSRLPPIAGLDAIDCLSAENWLARDALPGHLLMVGAGAIGLEMALFYRRMGSQVTVIDPGDQVAGHEDADIAKAMQDSLEAQGIEFRLGCTAEKVTSAEGGLTLAGVDAQGHALALHGTHLFIATGRQPNTDDLGLDSVGVEVDAHGVVQVDERLATTVPGVWAVGDIRGGPMFTHTSWDDHRVLASQLLGDGRRTTERVVPYAVFTDPELGRVGLTESAAREQGRDISVKRFELKHNGKARQIGETEGVIKVIVENGTDQILGAAVLGHAGSELVHIYGIMMNARTPYTVLKDAVQIHPTLAEAVQSAVSD